MSKIVEVLRLKYDSQLSHAKIARSLGLSKGAVGVTVQRLWAEHVEAVGERAHRYTQFSQRYRAWKKAQKRSMRLHHRAGEKVFIDHAGPTVPVIDRHTGEFRQAQIFVAVFGASCYTFAEATWTQSLPE